MIAIVLWICIGLYTAYREYQDQGEKEGRTLGCALYAGACFTIIGPILWVIIFTAVAYILGRRLWGALCQG